MINYTAIIVMNVILVVITVLLAIADKLLVSYGTCKITVDNAGKKEEFEVEGGGNLLTALTNRGIKINSSCGGKGSCGYCKVQVTSGGGTILPTEEIYMNRQEKASGMRLACQVKIKNDMEIFIPDFLAIIRQMVVSKKFDPNKRWLVKIK
ncbi:MAG: 2Fe-2S iron-sulfur cluster binding domain-containing protein [Spirochaetales bacterium]|nr:MAG: 2Fe-2S iron-sulfur cluster binding domain-containing protein [Spirochaetales bacterium]